MSTLTRKQSMALHDEYWLWVNADDVLEDPSASHWLKNAISSASNRDVVDAINDAEALVFVLKTGSSLFPLEDIRIPEKIRR